MKVKLRSTSPVVKKADHLNLYLEQQGFDFSRDKNGEMKKPISCEKSLQIDGERVTEWYVYSQ